MAAVAVCGGSLPGGEWRQRCGWYGTSFTSRVIADFFQPLNFASSNEDDRSEFAALSGAARILCPTGSGTRPCADWLDLHGRLWGVLPVAMDAFWGRRRGMIAKVLVSGHLGKGAAVWGFWRADDPGPGG